MKKIMTRHQIIQLEFAPGEMTNKTRVLPVVIRSNKTSTNDDPDIALLLTILDDRENRPFWDRVSPGTSSLKHCGDNGIDYK